MKSYKAIKRRAVAVVTGVCSLFTCVATACGGGGQGGSEKIWKDSPTVDVWATTALAKVMKEGEFSDNLCDYGKDKSVQIEMAKNEYESAQIIISATDDVKEYFVSVTDLTDGNGNKLPKEAIEFFHQKYVKLDKKTVTSSPYVLGEYPEALVPMDKAVEYGENTVEAGYNQGIWLTVKTEHETAAGTYAGTVTVTVGKDSYAVPISVNVWDIDVSDAFHCTYISAYTTAMSFINDGDASQEKMDAINEFFLDYRVINETLAAEASDFDTFVENLIKCKDVENFYTFLPFLYNPFYTQDGLIYWDVDAMRSLLMKVIDKSVEDGELYTDMVWFYPYWYDEWQYKIGDGEGAAEAYLSNIRDEALFFQDLCKEVVATYDKCYGTDKIDSVAGLRESAMHIKSMISGEYSEMSAPYFEPYDVLTVSNWQLNQEERAYIETIRESGFEFCAYNCNWPRYPRLAGHVDSSLVEIRIFGWQMYDFDAIGMLYHRLGNDASFTNTYKNLNDIMLKFTANGDGHLAYPGAYYGMDGLVASTRLHAIRDSLEDYEYLYNLDREYEKLSEYYGVEISAEEFLDALYYTLYADNPDYEPNRDVNVFNDIRGQVFQSIIAAQSDEKMVLESKYDDSDNTYVKLLFSADCQLQNVSANPFFVSKEAAGQGYRYTFKFPKNEDNHNLEITYLLNGEEKTYAMEVNRGSVVIDSFENNDKGFITGTENVEISSVQFDGKSMTQLTFTSVITGDEIADSEYLSQAALDISALMQFDGLAAGYSIDVYNPTDKDITFNLYYETMILDKPIETVTVQANGFKTLTFYNLAELKKAMSILIRLPNSGTVENPDEYTLIISNLKYIKGGA